MKSVQAARPAEYQTCRQAFDTCLPGPLSREAFPQKPVSPAAFRRFLIDCSPPFTGSIVGMESSRFTLPFVTAAADAPALLLLTFHAASALSFSRQRAGIQNAAAKLPTSGVAMR